MRLLVPQSFVGLSCFCLVTEVFIGLIVSLTIGGVEFISRKIAVGFSRCSL